LVLPVVAAFWALTPNPAAADTTYTISNGNSDISGLPSPYGTLNVHLDATQTMATFLLTMGSGSSGGTTYFYQAGDGATIGLNLKLTAGESVAFPSSGSFSFTQLPLSGGNGTPTFSNGGTGNVDGWGSFNFQVNSSDGAHSASRTLMFTLTLTGGTWADDANVLTSNGVNPAVVHVMSYTQNPDGTYTDHNVTGFAVPGGGSQVVPEPSSIILGLCGLVGLGLTQIRRLVRRNPLALA